MTEWTEGICSDGAAILRDGEQVPITELLRVLNENEQRIAELEYHYFYSLSTRQRIAFAARVLDDHSMIEEAEKLRSLLEPPTDTGDTDDG